MTPPLHLKDARLAAGWNAGLVERFSERQAAWSQRRGTQRLYERDQGLFTSAGEDQWLGWLDLPGTDAFADVRAPRGVRVVLLLGMGGSSLGAEMLYKVLRRPHSESPRLVTLDTTNPATIASTLAGLEAQTTLVVVGSKSGGTLETKLLFEVVWEWLEASSAPSARLVGVTDPGSALEELVEARSGRVVHGDPTIGGRFSVLSSFGLVPAQLCGLDVAGLLQNARAERELARQQPVASNPAVALGLALAAAHDLGHSVLSIEPTRSLTAVGPWIEQLVAESTGKGGNAVLPIAARPGTRASFGARLLDEPAQTSPTEEELEGRILTWPSATLDLGGEIYRWEVATAVLGAEMGLNPFTQPDVESAKRKTREITDRVREQGCLPVEDVLVSSPECDIRRPLDSPAEAMGDFSRMAVAGAVATLLEPKPLYVALLSYLPETNANRIALDQLADAVCARTGGLCSVDWGPRYLHSTGQAHKGGPAGGSYLVITGPHLSDIAIPGDELTLASVCDAQAIADAAVLAARGRRVLRLHVKHEAAGALAELSAGI